MPSDTVAIRAAVVAASACMLTRRPTRPPAAGGHRSAAAAAPIDVFIEALHGTGSHAVEAGQPRRRETRSARHGAQALGVLGRAPVGQTAGGTGEHGRGGGALVGGRGALGGGRSALEGGRGRSALKRRGGRRGDAGVDGGGAARGRELFGCRPEALREQPKLDRLLDAPSRVGTEGLHRRRHLRRLACLAFKQSDHAALAFLELGGARLGHREGAVEQRDALLFGAGELGRAPLKGCLLCGVLRLKLLVRPLELRLLADAPLELADLGRRRGEVGRERLRRLMQLRDPVRGRAQLLLLALQPRLRAREAHHRVRRVHLALLQQRQVDGRARHGDGMRPLLP